MEAESPFYTKKQGVVGAALASTMHSMASADIEGCCGSTLHLGRTCPARLRRRSAVFSHARASHSAFRGWRNAKCWGAPLSAGGRSFAPSSAVVGHKTQTRLGPSVHWFSGRAVERAVGYNASGPVPLHRPPLPRTAPRRGVAFYLLTLYTAVMSFEILFPFGLWVFEPGWQN